MRPPVAWTMLVFALCLATGCAVYPPAVFCQQDADCDAPGAVCDPETHRCREPRPDECVEEVGGRCEGGIVYWVDSCGRLGRLRETCDCGCRDGLSCEPCECASNADCAHLGRNHYCDPFLHSCECAASCAGQCCGDDGCGGACPAACPPGTRCEPEDCVCVQGCQPQTCDQLGAVCGRLPDGCGDWLECGPERQCQGDRVMVCEDGGWRQEIDCAQLGQGCLDGACSSPALCPAPLVCQPVTDSGLLGCLTQDGRVPADNQTGCQGLCEAPNQYCQFDAAADTVCIQECGACPPDQFCMDVVGEFHVCLIQEAGGNIMVPPDAPTGCWDPNDCPGNRMCWCLDADCADTVCLENCSRPF